MKDKWFRSSLIFDTISLKQISPLTQFVVLLDSRTSASQDKIIYSTEKKHTRSVLYELLYVSFSLFDSKWMHKNIFSLGEFFSKKVSFHEWWPMNLYTLVNKHTVQRKIIVHKLTNSNNKIINLLFGQKSPDQICQSPTQCPAYEHINSYIMSFLSYVGLRIFIIFNNIFKWTT